MQTGDLDPIYVALNRVGFDEAQRNRWLTAYCAYYSAGVACYMSQFEGRIFWEMMMMAAKNLDEAPTPFGGRWPRGHERRHFRGGQAEKGIADWAARHGDEPEDMFEFIARSAPNFAGVRDRALTHRSVGTWLSFKMVDLVDACMGGNIDQGDSTPFFYDAPRNSMLRQWRELEGWPDTTVPKRGMEPRVLLGMNDWLRGKLAGETSPHKPGQPLDNFCLETIWCKHQSHLNGHYPLYNDIDEINAGLAPWAPYSEAAQRFLAAMPTKGAV